MCSRKAKIVWVRMGACVHVCMHLLRICLPEGRGWHARLISHTAQCVCVCSIVSRQLHCTYACISYVLYIPHPPPDWRWEVIAASSHHGLSGRVTGEMCMHTHILCILPPHPPISPSHLTLPLHPPTSPSHLRKPFWPTIQSQDVWVHKSLMHMWLTYSSGSKSTSWVGHQRCYCACAHVHTHATLACTPEHACTRTQMHPSTLLFFAPLPHFPSPSLSSHPGRTTQYLKCDGVNFTLQNDEFLANFCDDSERKVRTCIFHSTHSACRV